VRRFLTVTLCYKVSIIPCYLRSREDLVLAISVLFRGRGMKRCRDEGRKRFELWVGAAVLANNLMRIAALLSERSRRKRKAA
jgi:IS5 family transposase